MTPNQFLEFMASVSLQATIVVFVTSSLCRIVETPRLQCRLWSTCHALLLVLLGAGATLPHLRVLHPWQGLSSQAAQHAVSVSSSIGQLVLAIWVAGAVVSLILLAREWSRAFRFLRTCRPAGLGDAGVVEQLEQLAGPSSGSGTPQPSVRLLFSDRIGSPFCCQWHQPHLVLPEFLSESDPASVNMIARHELEHLRSGHPLQLFVERLAATIFWFHPAVWYAARQSSIAREFACDDAAVSGRREIVTYLKTLLAVAERGMTEEAEGAVLFFGRRASIIAMRGRRLVERAETEFSEPEYRENRWLPAVVVAVAMVSTLVWAPLDVLASSRADWSPWPSWSAGALRAFDIPARDYEPYGERTRVHEISEQARIAPTSLPN